MKHHVKSRSGQTAVLFTLILTSLFGVAGLVTDFGWAYYRKQTAQAAAQSAAMATVKAAMTMSGGICGQRGVICQGETACSSSINVNGTMSNIDKGCLYAQQNGYLNSGRQKVTIETGTLVYGTVAVTYWATAKVSEDLPQLFSLVTGNPKASLTAKSVVGYVPATASGCIYVIAPTGTALTTNGNTQITTGCGIWVNSSDPSAINLSGGNTTITDTNPDTKVQIVGGYSCYGQSTGCITPAPNTGANSSGDPLSGLPAPTPDLCTPIPNLSHGNNTINPGTYCGTLSVQSNQTLTMNAGTYIFKSGGGNSCGFAASGNGNVTANGVTLYFQDSCQVSITGNGNVDMSAPTSGIYQGILMFQGRTDSTASALTGGAGQVLNGILYFPDALLHYAGGSSSNINAAAATIVAYNLSLDGSSYIWNAGTSPYMNTFSGYAILE
jgi:hypothetical protein